MSHGLLHRGRIAAFRVTEDVDGDDALFHEAHATENLVHDHLHIGATLFHQREQCHRIVTAHGVVRGDDDGTFKRNVFDLVLGTVDGQIEILDVGLSGVGLSVDHAIGHAHLDAIDLLDPKDPGRQRMKQFLHDTTPPLRGVGNRQDWIELVVFDHGDFDGHCTNLRRRTSFRTWMATRSISV